MDFEVVDVALAAWLPGHDVHVLTRYRDDDVRSIPVVDDQGDQFSIWFDPTPTGVEVHAEDHPTDFAKRRHWVATYRADSLVAGCDEAWRIVHSWITERSHTRG